MLTVVPLYKWMQRQTDSRYRMAIRQATFYQEMNAKQHAGADQEEEEKEEDMCPICRNNLSAHFSDGGGMSAVLDLTANNEGTYWSSLDCCSHGNLNKQ